MTAPHVLHVTQPVDGGVGRYVAAAVLAQRTAGLRVTVASPEGEVADAVRAAGVDHHRWPALRSPGVTVPAEAARLRAVVRAVAPDVVHLHSSKAGLVGRLVVRGRRPTIFQPHGWAWQAQAGLVGGLATRWERLSLQWTTALVCVSAAEQAAGHARRVGLVPAGDAGAGAGEHIITNGVDLDHFRPVSQPEREAARRRLELPPGGPLAVCVGRLDDQKGQDILLRAWPKVVADVPAAVLVLVGSGPRRPHLEALAGELAVASSVRFAGEVTDVRPWYQAADLVAFSSLWGEAMALTPLEAMGSGLPVVASDVAGIRESVGEGCGAIVPAGDVTAFASALADRLRDLPSCRREGGCARRHAEQRLDLRRTHQRLLALTCSLARATEPAS